ncbi:MAG: hypothetical protein IJ841_03945 [Prevotella sp.]|nr:hypothetical protein [Prevotella sp.]
MVNGTDVTDGIIDNELTIADIRANTQVSLTFERASTATLITMANEMQTYCPIEDVDFSGMSGLKAYTATGYDHGVLTVSRVLNAPAGTGLLIVGEAGTTYQVPYAQTTGYYINLLHGLMEDTWLNPTEDDQTNYVLGKKNGVTTFYRLSAAGTVGAGKAYLQLPTSVVGNNDAGGRPMRIVADDETTGISETLTSEGTLPPSRCYNLKGMRVDRPAGGIYIIDGRKVFIGKKGGTR